MAHKFGFSIGMPTDVDVKLLVDAFGVPDVGAEITYKQVEDLLKVRQGSARFQTVTQAWRKKLFNEHNVHTTAIPTVGFRIADPSERVGGASRGFKGGLRKIKKAAQLALTTPRTALSADENRTADHIVNTSASLSVHAALAARKLRELPPEIDAAQISNDMKKPRGPYRQLAKSEQFRLADEQRAS